MVVGIDLIPLRFFAARSGPADYRTARTAGFEAVWNPEHSGFEVKIAYIGMTQRDLENVLDELRKNKSKKQKFRTTCGHEITKLDDVTYRIRNTTPFAETNI